MGRSPSIKKNIVFNYLPMYSKCTECKHLFQLNTVQRNNHRNNDDFHYHQKFKINIIIFIVTVTVTSLEKKSLFFNRNPLNFLPSLTFSCLFACPSLLNSKEKGYTDLKKVILEKSVYLLDYFLPFSRF